MQQSDLQRSSQPIATLNPFLSDFTICARVTKITNRSYKNQKGEGIILSLNLLDSHGGEISFTAFNEIATKLKPILREGNIYYIQSGRIQKPNYSELKAPYSITANDRTRIIECEKQNDFIPNFKLNPQKLEVIEISEPNSLIDLIVVIAKIYNQEEIQTKNGPKNIRKIVLIDDCLCPIEYTIWGDDSNMFEDIVEKSIILIKSTRVIEYSGQKKLTGGTIIKIISPEIKDISDGISFDLISKIEDLKIWSEKASLGNYNKYEGKTNCETKIISSIDNEMLGQGEKADIFESVVWIRNLSNNQRLPYYDSCGRDGCKKKVLPDGNNFMFCSKCQTSSASSKAIFLFNLSLCDFSGNKIGSVFGETGEILMGMDANKVKEIRETDENEYNHIIRNNNNKMFSCIIKAKTEEYNGDSNVKLSILKIEEVDWVKEGNRIVSMLNEMA